MAGAGDTIHATAIAVAGRAVLIRGRSGAGKSDLALRCLGLGPSPLLPEPARLVADDRVALRLGAGGRLMAFAPEPIAGLLEVRGLGIITLPHLPDAEVVLAADLIADGELGPERLPEAATTTLLGRTVRVIRLRPLEPSAPVKLLLALRNLGTSLLIEKPPTPSA